MINSRREPVQGEIVDDDSDTELTVVDMVFSLCFMGMALAIVWLTSKKEDK